MHARRAETLEIRFGFTQWDQWHTYTEDLHRPDLKTNLHMNPISHIFICIHSSCSEVNRSKSVPTHRSGQIVFSDILLRAVSKILPIFFLSRFLLSFMLLFNKKKQQMCCTVTTKETWEPDSKKKAVIQCGLKQNNSKGSSREKPEGQQGRS